MRPEHRWMDESVRRWIEAIEDENLLRSWSLACVERAKLLEAQRTFSLAQLIEGFAECKRGEPLYAEKRVRFGDQKLRDTVYFAFYQPRAKRLWVYPTKSCRRSQMRKLDAEEIVFHQVGRSPIEIRRRAMKMNHKQ